MNIERVPVHKGGLYDVTGNAWQWVADWYRADYFTRGGSFLCNVAYCLSYRLSARCGSAPTTRCRTSASDW